MDLSVPAQGTVDGRIGRWERNAPKEISDVELDHEGLPDMRGRIAQKRAARLISGRMGRDFPHRQQRKDTALHLFKPKRGRRNRAVTAAALGQPENLIFPPLFPGGPQGQKPIQAFLHGTDGSIWLEPLAKVFGCWGSLRFPLIFKGAAGQHIKTPEGMRAQPCGNTRSVSITRRIPHASFCPDILLAGDSPASRADNGHGKRCCPA